MSKTTFIQSFNPLNQSTISIQIPAGNYSGFLVEFKGTSATGKTATFADLGTIRLVRNGDQKQSATWSFYNNYDDLKGGTPYKFSGSAATAETVNAFIPLGIAGSLNGMYLTGDKELFMNFSVGSSFATTFASATDTVINVYGTLDNLVPELYELIIQPENITVNGAVTYAKTITNNVVAQYIDDTGDTILTSLSVQEDDAVVVDNLPKTILEQLTNIENTVESKFTAFFEVNFAPTGNILNGLNKVIKDTYVLSGAGTVLNTVFRINRNSKGVAQSVANARMYANKKQKITA